MGDSHFAIEPTEPRYVGKCEGDLALRLEQIRLPGPTEETHQRLSPLIRRALAQGEPVSGAGMACAAQRAYSTARRADPEAATVMEQASLIAAETLESERWQLRSSLLP
jgi:hypothetical protein